MAIPVSHDRHLRGDVGLWIFSLNNLSLFGLVLAIGIVVDDAIVVVENVDRWIERGLSPREASYRAMEEVTPSDHRHRVWLNRGISFPLHLSAGSPDSFTNNSH